MTARVLECQQALVAVLRSNDVCGGRVYDDASKDVAFPWVEIGDKQIIPDDATADDGGSDNGVSDFTDLHIWSRHPGKKEALSIGEQIRSLLHGQALTVTGCASALAWVRSERYLRDPDGVTRHGVISVEIIHRT